MIGDWRRQFDLKRHLVLSDPNRGYIAGPEQSHFGRQAVLPQNADTTVDLEQCRQRHGRAIGQPIALGPGGLVVEESDQRHSESSLTVAVDHATDLVID